jgi:hypothetical protein
MLYVKRVHVVLAIAVLASPLRADPVPEAKATAEQQLERVGYLVGAWNCAHTVGTFSGTYRTTYAKVLGAHWLQQTYDFPAMTIAGRTDPASTAVALMGFDERRQTWVRFFANSGGQYFPIRMNDTGDGWAWKYSTFFNRTTPETPGADATFMRRSATEYTIDGPTYPQNGVIVTEHHVCRKVQG